MNLVRHFSEGGRAREEGAFDNRIDLSKSHYIVPITRVFTAGKTKRRYNYFVRASNARGEKSRGEKTNRYHALIMMILFFFSVRVCMCALIWVPFFFIVPVSPKGNLGNLGSRNDFFLELFRNSVYILSTFDDALFLSLVMNAYAQLTGCVSPVGRVVLVI